MAKKPDTKNPVAAEETKGDTKPSNAADKPQKEYGGRDGPEPTRYGDWENKGIISDF